ncbi:MAG: alpha/beta fold hydrolase [Candidatus Methylomirabilia bacterium]
MLVHGACHGAWCWEAVAERLEARGHRVVVPDLPGHGRRVSERAKASVAGYARAVLDAMALEGVSRGIVVGHSMAGLVTPKVAELAPERVTHLVFLAAVVVPDGGSLFDTFFTSTYRSMLRGLAQGRGNKTYFYPAEMAWARWMNDLPRHHPTVQVALAQLTPQPLCPVVERVDLKRFYAMSVPRTYVRFLKDMAVLPEAALASARRLGVTPVDLDLAHDGMLSQPEAVAETLEKV